MFNKIIITDLPKAHGEIKGCWYSGYPIHSGHTKNSLNYATLYSSQNHIIPDQKRLKADFDNFKKTFKLAGLNVQTLPFPEELNQLDNLHHDAVFVRDSGFMFKNYWIKASFSAKNRQMESEVYSSVMHKKFNKEVVELPEHAYLEFGEVFYLKTKNGTFYFGGLSRSNKKGHDFVKSIIKPDHYCLIKSEGYHLDTVFSPVLSNNNELIAFIIADNMLSTESLDRLRKFNIEMIYVDPIDSSGEVGALGNYAINTFTAPGIMLNCAKFLTEGVEDKFKLLKIKRFISPLTDFRFAGGSYHCLTNEVYE